MKRFLTLLGGVIAIAGGLFTSPSIIASPQVNGKSAMLFFRPTEHAPVSETKPTYHIVPADDIKSEPKMTAKNARAATSVEGTKVFGIQRNEGMSYISSFTISANIAITHEFELKDKSMVWQSGCYDGNNYFTIANYAGFTEMYNVYKYDGKWQLWTNNMVMPAINTIDVTYNASDDKIYGIFSNTANTAFEFGTFDYLKNKKTKIADLSRKYVSVASNNSTVTYAIGTDGNLYSIDNTNGKETLIGKTGVTPGEEPSSACFNNEGNAILWIDSKCLYSIDPASGAAVKVTDIDGTWLGIFVKTDKDTPTPSWVENLKILFNKDELKGNVKFEMPLKDIMRNPIDAPLTYHIIVDGNEMSTGTAKPGEQIDTEITVTEGIHEFSVYASKDATSGLELKQTKFIGHDTPVAPSIQSVTDNEGIITITWAAVNNGVNDGYVDTESMTYTVVRNPGNFEIAKDTKAVTATDDKLPSMGYYTYSITPTDGIKTGAAGTSAELLLGKSIGIIPPYQFGFGEKGMGLFTQVNANGDNCEWDFDDKAKVVWLPSNEKAATDDWLFSPPIKLDGNSYYPFLMSLVGSQYGEKQRFEIRMGSTPTPEGMTQQIFPMSEFAYSGNINYLIHPDATGEYYIGLHITTPAVYGAIAITNFALEAGIRSTSPNVATNMHITSAENGVKQATISFETPRYTFRNNQPTTLTKAVVTNRTTNRIVKEFENPATGTKLSVVDNEPANGINQYAVTCYNESGAGPVAEAEGWVGPDVPGRPTNVRCYQSGQNVVISWDAPTEGEHKGYIDPTAFTYGVIDYNTKKVLVEKLTERTVTLKPELDGTETQIALWLEVVAVNEAGVSRPGMANQIVFGEGYETPFAESFEHGEITHGPWVMENVSALNYATPTLPEAIGLAIKSYDDDGMLLHLSWSEGVTRMCLPLLNLSTLDSPALKLYAHFFDSKTRLEVVASHDSGLTWNVIGKSDENAPLNRWHMITADLSSLKGATDARIALQAVTTGSSVACFDQIRIANCRKNDIMLSDMSLPSKIQAGSTFRTSVSAINNGLETISNYTVEFSINGTVMKRVECGSLKIGETNYIEVELPLSSNAAGMKLMATAICAKDDYTDNNTVEGTTMVLRSRFPEPTSLSNSSTNDSSVELSWDAPTTTYNATLVDDLESYENGSIGGIDVKGSYSDGSYKATKTVGNIGGYKLIDNDKLLTEYVYGVVGSNLPHLGQGMVCQVIDITSIQTQTSLWAAHSGNKFFCFWQAVDPQKGTSVANDDYLILPQLSEDDSHISFWAKSYTNKYQLCSFEIMVSFTGNEVKDFMPFQTIKDVPAGYAFDPESGYTFYDFELPEGTVYAAIHYIGFDSMALLVDDISYTPADNKTQLTLVGYNVYRNDVKLNETPITDRSFTDNPGKIDNYRYNVTSVFAEGESRYSNTVEARITSSVAGINSESAGCIRVDGREIVITGYDKATAYVYQTDGRLLTAVETSGTTRIAVLPGLYIIKVGNTASTVAVK